MPFNQLITAVKTAVRVTADGPALNQQGTRDGAAFTADYITKLALEGRVINASVGVSITPVTIAALTGAFALTIPQLSIDVPAGTTIIPISIQVAAQTEAGTLNMFFADTGTSNYGTGTSTPVTPRSTRSDVPYTTLCTVNSLFTGAGTTPSNPMEFWRASQPIASAAAEQWVFEWHYQQAAPIIIVGAGCLGVYGVSTTTAVTGYIKCQWAEIPSTSIV